MYTLRVHSLKSMSRLIGANELADLAADLELAGKQSDVDKLMKKTPKLLSDYRAFLPVLSQLITEDVSDTENNAILPDISDSTLQDAYAAIIDFTSCYDSESIHMVLDSLNEYHLQDKDSEKVSSIKKALSVNDWEKLRNILQI